MKPTIIIVSVIAFLFALVTTSWAIEADVIKKPVLDKNGNRIRIDVKCVIAAMWNNKAEGYYPQFLYQDKSSYVHTDGDKEREQAGFYPKEAEDQGEAFLTVSTPYAIKFNGSARYWDKRALYPTIKAIRPTLATSGTFTIEETEDTEKLRFYKLVYSDSPSDSFEVGSWVYEEIDLIRRRKYWIYDLAIVTNDTSSKRAKPRHHPFRFGPCSIPTMQHAPL